MSAPGFADRYARHLVLKGIGGPGQNRIAKAKVLIIGAGGLGSPAIAYLAAAGVGTLGIADDDKVSLSNLQRQFIHRSDGIDILKTRSAARFARDLNPEPEIITHDERITVSNADAIVAPYDLVLDGTDNFASRRLIAAAAARAEKPLISGAVSMLDGQLTLFAPFSIDKDGHLAPGFEDLYPDPVDDAALPTCEQAGVLGPTTGVIGSLMAMEALKWITGLGEPLIGRLLIYDGAGASVTRIAYTRQKIRRPDA